VLNTLSAWVLTKMWLNLDVVAVITFGPVQFTGAMTIITDILYYDFPEKIVI
jgi:hypothetical protein